MHRQDDLVSFNFRFENSLSSLLLKIMIYRVTDQPAIT